MPVRWLALTLIVCATAVLAQDAPKGAIEGTVVDALSKAPVADAEVSLSGSGAPSSATTGPAGDFRFSALAPGSYQIEVRKKGYWDSATSGLNSLRVPVKDAAATVAVAITPLSSLEGAVLDEDGRPFPGIAAFALIAGGSTRTITGRDGLYRFENLPPGDYQLLLQTPYAIRKELLVRDPKTGEQYGYPDAQYYPGVEDVRMSTAVTLAAGVSLQRFDFRLRRTLLVNFSGRALEMAGREPVRNAEVELAPAGFVPRDAATFQRRQTGPDGSFHFDLIQPGQYRLLVYRGHAEPDLPYIVPLNAGKTGIEDMPVLVPPYVRIQGTIIPPDPNLPWEGSVGVVLHGTSGFSTQKALSGKDGVFALEHIPPGQWQLILEPKDLRVLSEPPRSLYIESLRFGTQNVLTAPIEVTEGVNPLLEVLLSDRVGRIEGRVVDGGLAYSAGALVFARRLEGEIRSMMWPASSGPDGAFTLPDLPPGDYEVTAWPTGFASPAIQWKSCPQSARVSVKAGVAASLQLHPCQ